MERREAEPLPEWMVSFALRWPLGRRHGCGSLSSICSRTVGLVMEHSL